MTTSNDKRERLLGELMKLRAKRSRAAAAFERSGNRRLHAELLKADEAVVAKLRQLRDLTIARGKS
jgi:hypothetical protein